MQRRGTATGRVQRWEQMYIRWHEHTATCLQRRARGAAGGLRWRQHIAACALCCCRSQP